jgi:hypothetical protein
MATVTTPAGEVLEGVTGQLLEYYRGEGYEVTDEEGSAGPVFPVHFPPVGEAPGVEQVEVTEPEVTADPADFPPGPLDLH